MTATAERSRLSRRCAEIAQDRVIAGLVRLIERQNGRADEDQNAVAVDLHRVRRGGRRGRRLRGLRACAKRHRAERAMPTAQNSARNLTRRR
jgi:hypothetical protein